MSQYTLTYAAPELLDARGADPSTFSDIYSFAMLLWHMLTRRQPNPDHLDDFGFSVKLASGSRPQLPHNLSIRFKLLLEQLWHPEPSLRYPKPWRLERGTEQELHDFPGQFSPEAWQLVIEELQVLQSTDQAFSPADQRAVCIVCI